MPSYGDRNKYSREGNHRKNKRYPSYLDKLKSGEKELSNSRDANQVFISLSKDYGTNANSKRLVLNFDNAMAVVLKEATELLYPDIAQPLQLLEALGDEALTQGVYKDRTLICFEALYEAEQFFENVAKRLLEGRLGGRNDHSTIAWFLLQLGISGNEFVHSDPLVQSVLEFLKTSHQVGFPKLSEQLGVVFHKTTTGTEREQGDGPAQEHNELDDPQVAVSSLGAARNIMRLPGFRDHDNDKTNFRAIAIVPTTSELSCAEGAYLPMIDTEEKDTTLNRQAFALDRQFRLMREDLLGTVKEELAEEWRMHVHKRRRLMPSPSIVGVGTKPEPHVIVRVPLPLRLLQRLRDVKNSAAIEFFEKGPGKRVLQKGTLVVLVSDVAEGGDTDTKPRDLNIDIKAVGTVVERQKPLKIIYDSESRGRRVIEVGISFTPESMRFITPFLQQIDTKQKNRNNQEGVSIIGDNQNGGIFNASAGLFSLDPVLKALKRMDSVPMGDQLIHLNEPKQPHLPHGDQSFDDLKPSLQETVTSDLAQKHALEAIFRSNVVLVQGPPGTGKTYIGVQMVKAMLELENKSPKRGQPLRILCLCYTNHALDSFLLDLIDAGVPEHFFVRLGSSPKIDPKIKPRCLGEIDSNVKRPFGRNEKAAYASIKEESKVLENRFEEIIKDVTENSVWGRSVKWWNTISDWMETSNHYEKLDELRVPNTSRSDGFIRMGEGGKALKSNYLWERWFDGKGRGIFQDDTKPSEGLWNLKKDERKSLIQEWHHEWIQPKLEDLEDYMERMQKNTEAMRTLRRMNDLKVLENAKIIGCTTVAAAKFQGMINPSVVIVEEAGEILESHVLANLGQSCEQLIMIGDHKQLRPKIDNYSLQKESGNGFDLNVSLFERLVISTGSKIPVFPLTIQHRMRPEISRIIRGMALYESLEDHKNTKGRKNVLGVTNDVVFVDHRVSEKADEATAAVGMETKVNPFEVDMVVGIAKYIIQQGQYSKEQITILTPYLGQLSLIRKKLKETKIGSYVSDQDFGELAHHNLNDNSEKQNNDSIRIATVDNFQGEESEIVIISMVRSNPHGGRIGFLASEERINVLFSRAREGMYVVGNLESLTECSSASGRKLWSNLKRVLEENNNLYEYFPAKCQKHSTVQKIQTPEDFIRLAPEGGCNLRCTMILECGHQCPKKCHGHVQHVHSTVKCKEKVEDICSNGHRQLRECYSTVKCTKIFEWFCPRGHSIRGICMRGMPKHCKMCDQLEKLEKEAEKKREDREEELQKRKEQLMLTRAKLAAIESSKASATKLSTIELELELLEKQLSDSLAPVSKTSRSVNDIKDLAQNSLEPRKMLSIQSTGDSDTRDKNLPNSQAEVFGVEEDFRGAKEQEEYEEHDSFDMNKKGEFDGNFQVHERKDSPNLSANSTPNSPAVSSNSGNSTDEKANDVKDLFERKGGTNVSDDPISSSSMVSRNPINDSNEKIKIMDKAIDAGGNNLSQTPSVNPNSLLQDPNFCDALVRFKNKEFLEADDLIDNCLSMKQSNFNIETLDAFKSVLCDSLDPSEKRYSDANIEMGEPKTFEEAIKCWAQFVILASSSEFPAITMEIANRFLSYGGGHGLIADDLLEIGRERAKTVIEKARKMIRASSQEASSDESAVERQIKMDWERVCKRDRGAPLIVNEVMQMIGLFEVKEALIDQYHQIKVSQRQGDASASSYNVRFEGNPGTGKTTIARYYSTFLQQLTVLPENSVTLEVTAASLKNKGISHLEGMLEKVKKAEGGVVFVDEAYQLATDLTGEKILDFILPISESLDGPFGKLVWIFAGYPKEMKKLFEHNVGLPSRFPQRFSFADYTAAQMESIFRGFMEFKEKEPKKSLPSKTTRQRKTSRVPARRYLASKRTAYSSNDGETYVDRFGTNWTCNIEKGLWEDEYGNSTGYHPEDIGNKDNPLACSKDNQIWTHDGELWISGDGDTQNHYPGSTEAKPKFTGRKEPRKPPFSCENDKFLRIAMRRLERRSNRPGFGNARAVRILFDNVRVRQARRITKENQKGRAPDDFQFTKEDLLGVTLNETQLKKSEAYIKLQKMEGLKPVKEQIDLLIRLGASNLQREEAESPLLEIILNRVFLGNPGTGKTTVAKIYGQLLVEMGLLSKGEVIVKNPSDFKGEVLGSSERSTRDILRAAEGNVLVIDEAYALCTSNGFSGVSDQFGVSVIDTLVEQIQARPGDDRAVIMLGYRKEMTDMFKNVNPGLSRRFQLEQAYDFPDYDDVALLKILIAKAKESDLNVPVSVAKRAVRSLARARSKPNFGNAGAVDTLLSEAKERMQKRDGVSSELTLEDFAITKDVMSDETEFDALFADMIGMEGVRNKLDELKNIVKFAKARGENPKESVGFNYLFLGNPGTGKTTVARCMGKMFKMLGLLPDDTVYECSPKDFLTGFVGQAGSKTTEQLQKSRGGVLFIDEAYQLNPNRGGSFMTEVVDELVAKLTSEEFKGKILVLLAGYDADMNEMLKINPGLQSRFTERISFQDLTGDTTRDLIVSKLTSKKIPLSRHDACSEELLKVATKLASSKEFANGRDVDTVRDKTYAELANRSGRSGSRGRETTTLLDDVRKAVDSLLASREKQKDGRSCVTVGFKDQLSASRSTEPPNIDTALEESTKTNDEEWEVVEEGSEEVDDDKSEEVGIIDEDPFGTQTKDENPFRILNTDRIQALNDIVEEMNLNTLEGIEQLLSSPPSSKNETAILQHLMERLGISEDVAREILDNWKIAHKEVKRQKLKDAKKFKGMEAIWHCSVCGRGGNPRPICYFAPYISGYRPASS